MISTFPLVKGAIYDLLSKTMTPTQVSYGLPSPGRLKRETVLIAGSASWAQEWASLGAGAVDDLYVIEMQIAAATTKAPSFRVTTERAFALADQVSAALRDLGTVTGVQLVMPLAIVPGPTPVQEYFTDDEGTGRATLLEFGVQVRARIR